MKKFTTILIATAFSAALIFAQTPTTTTGTTASTHSPVQHQVAFLTTMLSLTADQQQQATTVFTAAATANSGLRSQEKTAHAALNTAVQNNDAAGIEAAATTLGNLTTQSVANQAKARAAFYQILTSDQKTKYNQFNSQNHFGGPGMGTAAAFRRGH